jgi:muramoyltetrapeptide carboxypeptidase
MGWTRRQVLTTLGTASLIFVQQPQIRSINPAPFKPKRLSDGAGVGLISPAGATFLKDEVNIVIDAVRALGLVPHLAPHLLDKYGYLAGTDTDRAADINQFFADPAIAMLLPIRGGWGCSRILPYLDYPLIRQNPKIIVGFSDITALILGIYARTGFVTFHGPNGLTSWRTDQTDWFKKVLFWGEKMTFANQKDPDDANRLMQVKNRIQTIYPGRTRGKLIGGNLTILSSLVGTPYFPDVRGAILFVEDIGENIYRIDRLMTQLKLAGIFKQISGFIFGQCINCLPDADYASLTLEEVIEDHISPLKIPAWYGAQIGHTEPILTFAIGIEVEIDSSLGQIKMLESGVV